MKKCTKESFNDSVAMLIGRLLESTDVSRAILSPAVCIECGSAWLLREGEPSQFSHHHGCRRGTHFNLRIMIERIGDTKAEREKFSDAWRARYPKAPYPGQENQSK